MKQLYLILALAICLTQCGCMTFLTVDSAKGHSYKDRNGEKVVTDKPKPENYWYVPLAVVGDTITLPF